MRRKSIEVKLARDNTANLTGPYTHGHSSLRLLTVQVQNVCDARRATPTRRLVGSAEG
jgi:hypothetical protein